MRPLLRGQTFFPLRTVQPADHPGTCGFSDPFEPDPEIPEVYRKEYRHINFGYAISSAYAKQGIVLAAARAMVDFARDHLESDTIAAVRLASIGPPDYTSTHHLTSLRRDPRR